MTRKTDYKAIKENVQIIDYARTIGYTPVRVGSYYTLKEHDSVRIDPRKNLFYRNATGEHGTVIDFALVFTGKSMSEVLSDLEKHIGLDNDRSTYEALVKSVGRPKNDTTENVATATTFSKEGRTVDIVAEKYGVGAKKELVLPPRDKNMRNVYAYLTKTRGIDRAVVDRMVKEKMLYQDDHKNCVFVSYENGRPVFACKRGTNINKRFVADVSGSDYSKGFLIDSNPYALCVCESVIDGMSLATFYLGAKQIAPDILCLSGTSKDEAVYNRLSRGEYEKVYLALDNDNAGFKTRLRIQEEIFRRKLLLPKDVLNLIPKRKDWNEDLLALVGVERT